MNDAETGNAAAARPAEKADHTARLHIRRGAPGEVPRTETFEVPFAPGQSVLDGLRWIRTHGDPGLTFRFSCINANACKECMMQIDGKVTYACTARLLDGDMQLAPLANKELVRDLVSEIAPPEERLGGKPAK
jgi:succinate dehydrogenase/fumarate reductase-like Fe-S protein